MLLKLPTLWYLVMGPPADSYATPFLHGVWRESSKQKYDAIRRVNFAPIPSVEAWP